MAHEHFMKDTGFLFEIDPVTRQISTVSGTLVIMQGDHRSEIITFEMPRYFDLHDMLLCNRVEVHYINVGKTANEVSDDVYDVKDMAVSEGDDNKVRFTWTIDGNGTIYAGKLTFSIQFKCTEGAEVLYRLGTAVYDALTVAASYDNIPRVAEEYSDIIATWDTRIKQSQSDWNAADGEPGHVKNRTHWVEQGKEAVLEETAMKLLGGANYDIITVSGQPIIAGEAYIVIWNGAEYTCVGQDVSAVIGAGAVALGDLSNEGFVGNGEPFAILAWPSGTDEIIYRATPLDGSTEFTVSVDKPAETIHKLPGKFLPEGVPYVAQDAEILPLTEFAFYEDMNAFVHTQKISLTAGETYRVIYNGQEYMCVCNPAVFQNMPVLVLGNMSPIGGADTGEPFSLGLYGDEVAAQFGGIYLGAFALDGAQSVEFAIYGPDMRKLDNRLLDLEWIPKVNKRVLIPEFTVTTCTEAGSDGSYGVQTKFTLGFDIPLNTTMQLIMVVDGVEYSAVGKADMDGTVVECTAVGLFLGHITDNLQLVVSTKPATTYTVSVYDPAGSEYEKMPEGFLPESVDSVVIRSSTADSTKKFKLTVDDSGTISVTEVTA